MRTPWFWGDPPPPRCCCFNRDLDLFVMLTGCWVSPGSGGFLPTCKSPSIFMGNEFLVTCAEDTFPSQTTRP